MNSVALFGSPRPLVIVYAWVKYWNVAIRQITRL